MSTFNNLAEKQNALSLLQAKFRGNRSRKLHTRRAKEGKSIICPFLASTPKVVEDLLNIVKPKITNNDIVIDLGSGDGSILVDVAKHSNSKCIGVEIDNVLCATAKRKAKESNVNELVEIIEGDIADTTCYNLKEATIIFTFLVPSCQQVVSKILFETFKNKDRHGNEDGNNSNNTSTSNDGIRIVAYKFPLPEEDGWKDWLVETCETEDVVKKGSTTTLYFYRI